MFLGWGRSWLVLVLAGLALAGCSAMPSTGPSSGDVKSANSKDADSLPYALVRLTPEAIGVLSQATPRLMFSNTGRRAPREIKFGVGDVVSVTIFEAAAGGLFIPREAGVRPGNFISLPNQTVDSAGNITVPFAGAIPAKNRTPGEVQQTIVDRLKNRAIEPQAVVSLIDQRTSLVSVFGEVNNPSRFPLNAAGDRILDAITRAGGPKGQGFDTWVMLERGGNRMTVPFGSLVYEPANNGYVDANDTIYVYREPQTFVAFGASGQQGQFNFEAWRISLAEALAKAGGLNDSLADPASVFVYRGESRDVAEKLGIDVSRFSTPLVPVVYVVNLRDPATYFLATKMQIRNKDVLYASNATAVETAKILQFIRLVNATVNDPIVTATNAYTLRGAIRGAGTATAATATNP
ncbi:polysaccharide biosynthesis/export family protein [Bradyrhizobium sp. 62]|uniref:polysaccharide biosynthesis/export family protein n=1 Tax=Bradyrhizobium sp. 62 TaxID=1043588 RepID=UPI001FFAC34B|nr:polysaccharide biosynthesis/export family protein [Bradyrhizobium sp. 62]MCK1368286.1 polysaccharide export protein [Bradyrhizobium sp. 62]